VLVAVPTKERRHKMMAIWVDPRRVVKLDSSTVLEVDNLVKGTRSLVHISHVKLYSDADLGREVELQAVVEQLEHAVFTIRKLLDCAMKRPRWNGKCYALGADIRTKKALGNRVYFENGHLGLSREVSYQTRRSRACRSVPSRMTGRCSGWQYFTSLYG
jgi:hypothetical protein